MFNVSSWKAIVVERSKAGNNKKATEVIYDRLNFHLSGPNPVGEDTTLYGRTNDFSTLYR